MIPYSYNMVDMGGIDLAEANGTVVPGVYEKIVEAMNLCGDVILYNWKFAEINIVPSAYTILQQTDSILINGMIQVTELDEITVLGIEPPIVPVEPLEVIENGVYEAVPPQSGFNPVSVAVPEREPVIEPLQVAQNGVYPPPSGVDGFGPVTVNVSGGSNNVENTSIFRWYYGSATTCWGIMKKLTGSVIGQNGDNSNASISLVGDLMTVTFHGTNPTVEVVANVAIKLKAYTTGRTLGPANMTEYTMAVNSQQVFTTDNLYGGIYLEATEI